MGKRVISIVMALGVAGLITACSDTESTKQTSANEPIMTVASGQLEEGTHYFSYENILAKQDSSLAQADIVEFFSYSCHHCQEFAPQLEKWNQQNPSKKVSYVPVVWNQTTGLYARVYYAVEPLENFESIHHDMFKLFETFGNEKSLGEQLDKIYAMLEEKGVDVASVKQRLESKELEDKLRNSIELSKHYEISGTPTLIIEGAKRVNNKVLTSKEELFTYVDRLMEM
ncbi:DsbA family protein [Litoribrevibacter albus]|uniref:Thiol:disulfide interchange protein n=1 Tax=Litoribrevibacter albus TaxID=1473156 RepID=A0AA37SA45_9GAMM|nr:DsbA family protein [Litoribrevibacter albus]GLQ31284.1 thiol:disulfide interchange protein [Litoribrevibacter albus]